MNLCQSSVKQLAGFVFFIIFFLPFAEGKTDSLENEAFKAYTKGHINEAQSLLNEARHQAKTDTDRLASIIFRQFTFRWENPADTQYSSLIEEIKSLGKMPQKPLPIFLASLAQAEAHIYAHKEQEALQKLEEASTIYKNNLNHQYPDYQLRLYKDHIRALKGLRKLDETEIYFQKGLDLINNQGVKNSKETGFFYWSYGDIMEEKGYFDSALTLLNKGLHELDGILRQPHFAQTPVYNDIAATYKNLQNNDSALYFYNQGIEALRKNDMVQTERGGVFLMNRGIVYKHMSMHYMALRHFQKSRSIYDKVLPENDPEKIYINLNLASVSNNLNKYTDALKHNTKARKLINNQPNPEKYKNLQAAALFTLGATHRKLKNYKKSIGIFSETIEIFKELYNPTYLSIGSCHFLLAENFFSIGEYQKALEHNKKGVDIFKEKRGANHPSLAEYGYIKRAKILENLGDTEKGLETLQKGFQINSIHFEPTSLASNPKAESLIEKDVGFFNAVQKVNLYNNLHDSSNNAKYLINAFKASQLADTLLQQKIQSIDLQADKSRYVELSDDFYPMGLDIIHKLMDQDSESNPYDKRTLIKNVYRFAENDKATMLSSALSSRKILSTNQLPDSLTSKARQIQNQVNSLNDQLTKATDSSKIIDLQGKRLDLLEDKHQLYNQIKKQNPKYHQLLTQQSKTPLDELQDHLKNSSKNLVQYVKKKGLLYALAITPEDATLQKLPVTDSLKSKILQFRGQLLEDAHDFNQKLAFELYQKLIQPFENSLDEEEIVIVPDGIIGYLPFSTLMKSHENPSQNYLIRNYAFTYSPSATLWNFENHTSSSHPVKNPYVGFAPSIKYQDKEPLQLSQRDTQRSDLGPLPNAKKEIQKTLKFLKGQTYIGDQATESLFKQIAPGSKIIHLATHGILDDERPAYNRLLFSHSDTSTEDGKLHTYELYELELNADLAVLSACNTGFGTLKKGEGVMSLSRGFKIAGCRNILMTLWSVNDRASAKLIENFYKNLNEGINKNQALRKAKLDYLANHDDINANPYYWAGHVMMGSKGDLAIPSSSRYLWWGLLGAVLVILIVGLGFYTFKRAQKKAA